MHGVTMKFILFGYVRRQKTRNERNVNTALAFLFFFTVPVSRRTWV